MKVFVFDLLPYQEHLEHLKEGSELPWPLPKRHWWSLAPTGRISTPRSSEHRPVAT